MGLNGAFILSDGTKVPLRGITILHREAGEWKAVFNMAAIPVPNSALKAGSELARALAVA